MPVHDAFAPRARRIVALILLSASALVAAPPLPVQSTPQVANAQKDAAVIDEVQRLVRENFYDRTLSGVDWDALVKRHRNQYLQAQSLSGRSAVINALLKHLNASHTRHFTQDEPGYYQLADIFSYPLRHVLSKHFSGGKVSYSGIGMFTREIGGRMYVTGVMAGLPASDAGLLAGDEIVSADGAPFSPIGSFRGKTGKRVQLKVRRHPGGAVTAIAVKPEDIEPDEAFETAQRQSARIFDTGGRKIGYVRLWSYAGRRYQSLLAHQLSSGPLKDADALIWDLRDGWGGASPQYLDIFNPRGPVMGLTDRDGDVSVENFRWRKPVVLLINKGTRSGKEVLTYGFKKYGYGDVIGTRTAGALLAGRAFLLSDGSLLLLAVADVTVDGERLEGQGVAPTIEVPFNLPYAAGRDPQFEEAIDVLTGTLGG